MIGIQSSNQHSELDSSNLEPDRFQEEVFLNAFLEIAKKGIIDWEKTKDLKTIDS